jgi:hypothetical protein
MEIELTPELPDDIAEAVTAAVARALVADGDPGAWWREGLEENLEPELPVAAFP